LNPSQVLRSMAENKLPFAEGASINMPPIFSGVNYQFWKVKRKIFIESIDQGIWNAIVNGPYVLMHDVNGVSTVKSFESIDQGIWNAIVNGPYVLMYDVNGVSTVKSFDELSEAENKFIQYDCVAKNIITSALNLDEFFKVSQCNSAKNMWDILEVTHEGTNDVKRARKHALI